MIFTVILIAVLGGVAYFHYAQGFFSATLSAVCAAVAAAIAVGYHEVVVTSLLQGAAGDYAHAMVLGGLFAITYIILRLLFDKAVPGNIRLPVIVDRVGGAAAGVVAGVFTAGIVALAAQMLPFGPTIGGYARYEVETREEVNIPAAQAGGRMRNANINEQMKEDTFVAEKQSSVFPAVDKAVLGFVDMLSKGSMAANTPLSSVHPDYPDELFGQRIGMQIGAKRTAMNLLGKTPQVTVPEPGVFRMDQDLGKGAVDNELKDLHQRAMTYSKKPNDLQLVVRLVFNKDASDKDMLVRISTGAVRLVADGTNFWPIGTLEGSKLYLSKADDFLFLPTDKSDVAVDFLFVIDDPSKVVDGGTKDPQMTIKDGVFIEAKRLARVDLSGKVVTAGIKPAGDLAGIRRKAALSSKSLSSVGNLSTEVTFNSANLSTKLFSSINTGSPDADIKEGTIPSGTFSTKNKQFTKLNINATQSLAILSQGENVLDDLHAPAGLKLVQVRGNPPNEGDQWAWATLSKWQLADAAEKTYPPAGGFARVTHQNAERMVATYADSGTPPDPATNEGKPVEFFVVFLVPDGTHVKQVKFNGKLVSDLDMVAK